MITLEGVTKVFNQGRHNEVTAVAGVDLEIADGRVTVLRGPSGSCAILNGYTALGILVTKVVG